MVETKSKTNTIQCYEPERVESWKFDRLFLYTSCKLEGAIIGMDQRTPSEMLLLVIVSKDNTMCNRIWKFK